MPSAIPERFISGDTEELMLNGRYPPISGSMTKDEKYETAWVASSKRPLDEAEVTGAPDAATITANTGINESIKVLHAFIAPTDAETEA